MSPPEDTAGRRRFLRLSLRQGSRLAAVAAIPGAAAASMAPPAAGPRSLGLAHLHTGERLDLVYAAPAGYLAPALRQLNHFLRDHHSGEAGVMDPRLFDLMHGLRSLLGTSAPFEIVSAYRCPATNARLQRTRGGGVATRSLHLDGRAIDLRLPGVPLTELRDAALALRAGGVGHYPREQFVHIDTGPLRRW